MSARGGRRRRIRLAIGIGIGAAGGAAVWLGRQARPPLQQWCFSDDRPVTGDLSGAPSHLLSQARTNPAPRSGAHVAPVDREPLLLQALASWEPALPRTRAGRVCAYLWAAPLTLAGLLAAATAGVAPRLRDGVVVVAPAAGPPAWVLRRRGFSATTWGHVVLALIDPDPPLWAHELVHVRQAERLGPAMAPTYLLLLALYGYSRHPMERAARQAQRRRQGA